MRPCSQDLGTARTAYQYERGKDGTWDKDPVCRPLRGCPARLAIIVWQHGDWQVPAHLDGRIKKDLL